MSAQRMTLEPCKSSGLGRAGRSLRLAAGLIALAIPLSGCGTGALWDKFTSKDDTFNEEPADKLYNEGLYLMNQRKDPCLLYTSPSPRDGLLSRMPSSA